jgi:hypothetical protein
MAQLRIAGWNDRIDAAQQVASGRASRNGSGRKPSSRQGGAIVSVFTRCIECHCKMADLKSMECGICEDCRKAIAEEQKQSDADHVRSDDPYYYSPQFTDDQD